METYIRKFEDFVNEELNFERISDTECYLTRPWYFYNYDDDIVYGSDKKPIGNFPLVYENNIEDGIKCLLVVDLERLSLSVYTGSEEVLNCLNKIGFPCENFDDEDGIQDFFESDENTRYMLVDGKRLLASSFDIIEEN